MPPEGFAAARLELPDFEQLAFNLHRISCSLLRERESGPRDRTRLSATALKFALHLTTYTRAYEFLRAEIFLSELTNNLSLMAILLSGTYFIPVTRPKLKESHYRKNFVSVFSLSLSLNHLSRKKFDTNEKNIRDMSFFLCHIALLSLYYFIDISLDLCANGVRRVHKSTGAYVKYGRKLLPHKN